MIRYPVTSAPFMTPLPDSSIRGTESAASLARDALARDTLVLACCDPAAGFLASQFQAATGLRMIVVPRSSSQAIAMLQKGLVHLAGLHFSTAENPDQNATVVRERLGADFEMIRLSRWQEGIVLSSRCSHRTVGGVLRGELTWVGRENGSGARQCLDRLLQGRRAPRRIAHNHQGVAAAVQSGWADAGVCVQLVSEEAGLRFLPVQQEAFDVCFAKAFAADRRFRAFVNVVRSAAYRNLVGELPGYDVAETGSLSGTL